MMTEEIVETGAMAVTVTMIAAAARRRRNGAGPLGACRRAHLPIR